MRIRHDWPAGFQLLVILTPKFDLNDWTVVFHFKEAIDVRLEYFAWEAKLTVSNGGRVATLTNLPWNSGIKKGEKFRFILVVTGFYVVFYVSVMKQEGDKNIFLIGAARTSLPPFLVQYMDGSKDDMSCLYESHYDTTTTATIGLTSTTTAPLVTTTKTPQEEDPEFCSDKNDGLYAHPDCSKASNFFIRCFK